MSEINHIARPYARAIFAYAQSGDRKQWSRQVGRDGERRSGTLSLVPAPRMADELLLHWQEQLDLLALIAADSGIVEIIANPRVSNEQLLQVILDVTDGKLSAPTVNLLKILVQNGRVPALPAIARAYAELRAEAMRVTAARVTTPLELEPRRREQFAKALRKKLGRNVELEFEVDPELIGGAVVRAGDLVIDASVRAQLRQLAGALGA